MPSEASHLAIANRNQTVLDYLLQKPDGCAEWIVTVAFYKALHLVEAIFARDPKIRHGLNHETRDRFLKTERRYSHIWKHYRPLWAASIVARYLEGDSGSSYTSFSEYLSTDEIKMQLLDHRLRQIEQSVHKLLSSPPT